MRKILLWTGLVMIVVFGVLIFLSGASNGPEMKPIWPAIYGTNQALWTGLAFLGLILLLAGLIMTIVHAMKNKQKQP